MNCKSIRTALRVTAIVALAAFVTTGAGWAAVQDPGAKAPATKAAPKPTSAQKQAVSSDGFRNATRLGGARALMGV